MRNIQLSGLTAGMGAAVLLGASLAAHGQATLNSVLRADEEVVRLAQASQERVDKIVEDTRSALDKYRSVTKEVDGLNVYNTLLQRQVDDQLAQIEEITNSIERVTEIERQITPLMLDMVESLAQFVELDVPFLADERADRIQRLRETLERSDVSVAEKFRVVLEAYEIEVDYGRNIETYADLLEIDGTERPVDILRVGRTSLYYQTSDQTYTGVWDQKARQWQPLSESQARNEIRKGIRMAGGQLAPDLLMLPTAAPEAAR
ncbi:MAG: DUF3450 domain-containing protein [Pseudomonadota bacterium]